MTKKDIKKTVTEVIEFLDAYGFKRNANLYTYYVFDGVRYDKVKTDVSPHNICDMCDLHWLCEPIGSTFPVLECKVLSENNECWKRCEQ